MERIHGYLFLPPSIQWYKKWVVWEGDALQMRRSGKSWGAAAFAALALFMLVMPLWQLADWYKTKGERNHTLGLLYQVSAFQMELLGSTLGEAGQVKSAGQLNEWRQSAYAAGYVHDRLSEAVGKEELPKLEAPEALVQWILRIQIGGDRPLRQEEAELLKETAKRFQAVAEPYRGFMDGSGGIAEGKLSQLVKADRELAEWIRKRLK